MKQCYIGIDVGLTAAKAAAFDAQGNELRTFSAANPRQAVDSSRQEIPMIGLWEVVATVLRSLTDWLAAEGWQPVSIGATGHGNGLYLVDENLEPVRPAIASTDSRADPIVRGVPAAAVTELHTLTGSVPWAGQPGPLLAWLSEHEPDTLARARWALSCKDWLTLRLTGRPGGDLSDASGEGLLNLSTRDYEPLLFDALGVDREVMRLLPPLAESDRVVGEVTDRAAEETGLPLGLPVVAGCMDCIASPMGAGALGPGDVTVIVGTWAINSVVVPVDQAPPAVTLNAFLPDPALMLAQEVAPTSAASIEWFSTLMSTLSADAVSPRQLLAAAANVEAGADGVLFLPFVHGAPDHAGASGTFLGLRDNHGYAQMARAVAEGITQYHRVQLEKLGRSGAQTSNAPWTLAGGGAKNPVWAQMFADIIGHPVRRQTGTELGARGVASLAARGIGHDVDAWVATHDDALVVEPGPQRAAYQRQSERFDAVLAAMESVWTENRA
ncbi:MAG: FGGY-family carbohydrate kinase [Mycetocola sp.]